MQQATPAETVHATPGTRGPTAARARHAPPASSKPCPGPPHAPTVPVAPTLRPQGLSVRAPALPALQILRLLPVCVVHYHTITSHVTSSHHARCVPSQCVWHTLVCAGVYVCVRERARASASTRIHVIYAQISANARTHLDMHAHTLLITHTHIDIHAHMLLMMHVEHAECLYIHMYACAYTHAYIYIDADTHKYIYTYASTYASTST